MRRSSAHAPGRRLCRHGAAQLPAGHLAEAGLAASGRRPATPNWPPSPARPEGGALPPAACRRLGGAPGRRHGRIARPHGAPRWTASGPTRPRCSAPTRSTPRPRPAAWARPAPTCVRTGGRRAPRAGRSHAGSACRHALRQHRQRRACTASTWASCWPRCSRCSAYPGGAGDAATADTRSRADRAWAVLHQVPDPEVPVLSVCDLGIVREVQATTGRDRGGADAHLQRLPGHRGHRAERARRTGGRRLRPGDASARAARRPGPPTGSAPTAAASCASTASPRRRATRR
jgi:hypothetical protein